MYSIEYVWSEKSRYGVWSIKGKVWSKKGKYGKQRVSMVGVYRVWSIKKKLDGK